MNELDFHTSVEDNIESFHQKYQNYLEQAAHQMSLKIADNLITLRRGRSFLAAASIAGLEKIDPVRYSDGVDVAINYIKDLPQQQIPNGIYLIRTDVKVQQTGLIKGAVHVVSPQQKVVARLPAIYNIFSLKTPSENPNGVEVAGNIGAASIDEGTNAAPPDDGGLYLKCHENGGWICYRWWIDSL